MGEIDAGAENALTPIFLVVHRGPPHYGYLGRSIEGCDVDGELGLSQGRVVLGVEEAGVDHVEMDGLAASGETRRAEIERAARGELGDKRGAFRTWQEHCVTEMFANARARKRLRKEQALVDLDAVLVALPMSGLRVDLVWCWE